MKKPEVIKTEQEIISWIRGVLQKNTQNSKFGKDSIDAEFQVECLYRADDSDWKTLISRKQATASSVAELQSELEDYSPCAIGVTIWTKDKTTPFVGCKLTDEHIVAFDGKSPVAYKAGQRQREEEELRSALSGIGADGLGKIAELDKQNTILQYQSEINNLNTMHRFELSNKERDIKELREKIDELKEKNADLQKENDEFYSTIEKYARQIEMLQSSSADDTKKLLLGIGRDIMASRGMHTEGLSGYLGSQQQPEQQIALPEAQFEQAEPIDEKVVAIVNWYNGLPDITKAEMLEIMKFVERKPILSRKLLNYLHNLALKLKERERAQVASPDHTPQTAAQPQFTPAEEPSVDSCGSVDDIDGNDDNDEEGVFI